MITSFNEIDEEDKDSFTPSNNINSSTIEVFAMKRHTLTPDEYVKNKIKQKLNQWSFVYNYDDTFNIYSNSTELEIRKLATWAEESVSESSSEEETIQCNDKGNIGYFIEVTDHNHINSNSLIKYTHIWSNANLLKINCKTLEIDLRKSSYNEQYFISQDIKILLLNVDRIIAFDSKENNKGYFNKDRLNTEIIPSWPVAYSLYWFLCLTNLIKTLDIIWINEGLIMNRDDLKLLISEHFEKERTIEIYRLQIWKPIKSDHEEEKKNDFSNFESILSEESMNYFNEMVKHHNHPNYKEKQGMLLMSKRIAFKRLHISKRYLKMLEFLV